MRTEGQFTLDRGTYIQNLNERRNVSIAEKSMEDVGRQISGRVHIGQLPEFTEEGASRSAFSRA